MQIYKIMDNQTTPINPLSALVAFGTRCASDAIRYADDSYTVDGAVAVEAEPCMGAWQSFQEAFPKRNAADWNVAAAAYQAAVEALAPLAGLAVG